MSDLVLFDAARPLNLLQACPVYSPAPLRACEYAGRPVLVKDETNRMGLGSFKALGGIYAVARLIEAESGCSVLPAEFLSERVRAVASGMTFVCASAGNHGLAVAAGAQLFGARARVHLAASVPEEFAQRLRQKGAQVVRSGVDYEASVSAAIDDAEQNMAIHLADGSWPGYVEPPRLVMEGYTVIAEEMREAFEISGQWPTHVYLQAGVGGLAAAIAQRIRATWASQPTIVVVEPTTAACLGASMRLDKVLTVEGAASTMGRLDCKTPSMLALNVLKTCVDVWAVVSDEEAQRAVGQASELGFLTTPSGAAGLAAALRDETDLPLVILTEGGIAGY